MYKSCFAFSNARSLYISDTLDVGIFNILVIIPVRVIPIWLYTLKHFISNNSGPCMHFIGHPSGPPIQPERG